MLTVLAYIFLGVIYIRISYLPNSPFLKTTLTSQINDLCFTFSYSLPPIPDVPVDKAKMDSEVL